MEPSKTRLLLVGPSVYVPKHMPIPVTPATDVQDENGTSTENGPLSVTRSGKRKGHVCGKESREDAEQPGAQ